jgi:putative transposase
MPRHVRIRSNSGYYHIMLRGNEQKSIFHDDFDRNRFLEILSSKKENNSFYLHAFCLMNNHIHLMLSEYKENISTIMKRINISYVSYFNLKYKRVGHLFQDRFKSEIVENDNYVLSLARYIHQNPVKAGIVNSINSYNWSSYNSYLNEKNEWFPIVDKDTILSLFSNNKNNAMKEYIRFMNEETKDSFIDLNEENQEELKLNAINEIFKKKIAEVKLQDNNATETIIKEFKKKTNLSIREIASLSGFNKDRINKILKS